MQLFRSAKLARLAVRIFDLSRCKFVLDRHSTSARIMERTIVVFPSRWTCCWSVWTTLTHSHYVIGAVRLFVCSINFAFELGRWQIASLLRWKVLKTEHFTVIDVVSWVMNRRKWSRFRCQGIATVAERSAQNTATHSARSDHQQWIHQNQYRRFIIIHCKTQYVRARALAIKISYMRNVLARSVPSTTFS